ncbi:sigma-70 family RNA polymerase sigma factor [Lusitaniella coriacea]|uniref:sigma-70 family RNA polymerase sigma factor n=1 Tax=Lusitaniella coriacea TaxID=1983105 RepID=UPI003CF2A8F9
MQRQLNSIQPPIMQEFDARLKKLALEAQQHPPKSRNRQKALSQLVTEIQSARNLVRPFRGTFRHHYREIYEEAKHRLFCHICEKIEQYDPKREVMQWVNFLLRKRFFVEACREKFPQYRVKAKTQEETKWVNLDALEEGQLSLMMPQETPSLSEEILQCLEEDPEGLFKQTYTIKPEASFYAIAQRRLNGYRWNEISAEFDLPVSTLNSFYLRAQTKFASKFQEYLSS